MEIHQVEVGAEPIHHDTELIQPGQIKYYFQFSEAEGRILQTTESKRKIDQLATNHPYFIKWCFKKLVEPYWHLAVQSLHYEATLAFSKFVRQLIFNKTAKLPNKMPTALKDIKIFLDRQKQDTKSNFDFEILTHGQVNLMSTSKSALKKISRILEKFMQKNTKSYAITDNLNDTGITDLTDHRNDTDITDLTDHRNDTGITDLTDHRNDTGITDVTDHHNGTGITDLTDDLNLAQYLNRHWKKLNFWRDFTLKYTVIVKDGKFRLLGNKAELLEGCQNVKKNLKSIVKYNLNFGEKLILTNEQLRRIESETLTIVLPKRPEIRVCHEFPTGWNSVWNEVTKTKSQMYGIKIGSIQLEIVHGDIAKETTDVIICSTGEKFQLTSQVAISIATEYSNRGNSYSELKQKLKTKTNDDKRIIPMENMSFKAVFFHISKSKWDSVILDIFKQCDSENHHSIALPAIGTGLAKQPMNKMVKMLWSSVTKFAENKPTSLKKVRLVLFEEKLVSEVQQEILTVSETFQFANDEKTTCFQDCEVHGEHKNKIQVVKQLTQYLKCTKSVHLPCLIDLNVNQASKLQKAAFEYQLSIKQSNEDLEIVGVTSKVDNFINVGLQTFQMDIEESRRKSINQLIISLSADWIYTDGKSWWRVPLPSTSAEFIKISRAVADANKKVKILSIESVKNPVRYCHYLIEKEAVSAKLKNTGIQIERNLFHGTKEANIDPICSQGFTREHCGTNGTAYGKGLYFSPDFNHSLKFCERGKKIFYCNVITGKVTPAKPELKIPQAMEIYDSLSNKSDSPNIFVVFSENYVYPSYVITLV